MSYASSRSQRSDGSGIILFREYSNGKSGCHVYHEASRAAVNVEHFFNIPSDFFPSPKIVSARGELATSTQRPSTSGLGVKYS